MTNQPTSSDNRVTHEQLHQLLAQFRQDIQREAQQTLTEAIREQKMRRYNAVKEEVLMRGLSQLFRP